ncbi:galactose-1-phosphate uridylyltransferase [uncultured Microbacterium sp.]|uniref:galactose-1-phosphate uridylyltransferase n=1 Tax=uncultured Microbacterium sp. TaxID=191216 RepID=UPI0028D3FAAD|nr:galactose-1-phosphate uridylyltransferase [uncultured Microbacterium sp.]
MNTHSLSAVPLRAGVVKRPTRLADGRELIYFDDPGTTLGAERAVDARTLDPRPATATMRQDVLTGDWITVASNRQNRAFLPPAHLDPLSPQTPTNPSEIPSLYDVAVFENKSPSFGPALDVATDDAPAAVDPPLGDDDLEHLGLGRTRTSVGRCEVVCFSPAHEGSFGSLSRTRARTVIEAWADRTAALSALPGIRQVFPFENRGQEIGVTLPHPHGQIYAYPYVTPRTHRLLDTISRSSENLFQRILDFESAGERVVLRGEHWTAFIPFAARWPVEVHVLPHRHVADLAETTDAERDELAPFYLRLLRGIDALYDTPTPYIAAWHQAPIGRGRDAVRLNLQITSPRRSADKLKYLAGSEAAMGAWIGDVTPESQAERLRAALDTVPEVTA